MRHLGERVLHSNYGNRQRATGMRAAIYVACCLVPLAFSVSAHAATITAASCSDTDVQNAMNSAAPGDMVLVSGTCSLSAVTISSLKPITLCATTSAGSCVPAAVGTQANPAGSSTVSLAGFNIQCGNGQSRIAGFHVTGGGSNDINTCTTSSPMNRIDHNSFTAGHNSLGTHHNSPILVDHNSFQALLVNDEIIHNFGDQAPDSPPANYNTVWGNSIVPGSPNYPYFEYNVFIDNLGTNNAVSFIQNWTGAEVVFRDNQMIGGGIFDAHGNRYYKTRWFEIYNNSYTNEGSGLSQIRGGSGYIFNNTCSGTSCSWGFFEDPNTWLSYPSCNQVGRGITTGASCGNSSNSGTASTEYPTPVYVWGNTPQGVNCFEGTWHACNTTDQMIEINRDIIMSATQPSSMIFCEDSSATGSAASCTHTVSTYTPFTDPFPLNTNGLPNPSGTGSSTTACDLNADGSTNVSDVQLCVNQAIGASACTTGDINKDGACNVIDVQRDVNAALGGACVTQ